MIVEFFNCAHFEKYHQALLHLFLLTQFNKKYDTKITDSKRLLFLWKKLVHYHSGISRYKKQKNIVKAIVPRVNPPATLFITPVLVFKKSCNKRLVTAGFRTVVMAHSLFSFIVSSLEFSDAFQNRQLSGSRLIKETLLANHLTHFARSTLPIAMQK